jgi:GTP-binding protein
MEYPGQPMEKEIRRQAEVAMNQAERVIFVVDVKTGITSDDEAVADALRRTEKQVCIAANKADRQIEEAAAAEFNGLGLGEPFPVSAMKGRGVGDLLDSILKDIPADDSLVEDSSIKVSVIGRPNVGKSSLVNAFLNEERHIVDDKPGTTRDSIDSKIKFYNTEITLIDTAGLRRSSRVREEIEFYSNVRTTRAISRCDIALVLFESEENITKQDARIVNEAVNLGKGVVLLANKWDLVEKETGTFEAFRDEVYFRIPNLSYIPLLTISATNKQRIHQVLRAALDVFTFSQVRIPTAELNEYLLPIIKSNPPPAIQNKYIRIKYISQVSTKPTVITFHCNQPNLVAEQYKRFLERKIRERFKFTGIPITLKFLRK